MSFSIKTPKFGWLPVSLIKWNSEFDEISDLVKTILDLNTNHEESDYHLYIDKIIKKALSQEKKWILIISWGNNNSKFSYRVETRWIDKQKLQHFICDSLAYYAKTEWTNLKFHLETPSIS